MPTPIKTKATVQKIIDHNDGIYTVRFSVPSRATRFKAGQFLHLTLDEFDPIEAYWPESRVFSIASKPGGDILEIVYSVKGRYTKRMSVELAEGKEVWLKLPYGDFIVEKYLKEKDEMVLIAGGTGISPFIPFLLERSNDLNPVPLTLYYGIRDENHFLYRDVIEQVPENASVNVVSGLFDIETISKAVANKTHTTCFISGPPGMIKLFQKSLVGNGFPADSIIIDAWE